MNNTTDPVSKALDRLARVADSHPVGDPMPGISRKARANRRRATVLMASGLAAAVAAGFAASSVVDFPLTAQDHVYANSPSAPSVAPSTSPSEPSERMMEVYDQARADVNGDGAADWIYVRVPEGDAAEDQDVTISSEDVWLDIDMVGGPTVIVRIFDETITPTIAGTPDLNGDGAAEMVLHFSGGDAGWLKVFMWDGETVIRVEPAPGSTADLVDDGGLYSEEGVAGSALVDDRLISWVSTGNDAAPREVRVWTWQLEGTLLVATEAAQTQCFGPGQQHPEPC